ncbi:MAG: hypothetical protein KA731_01640 [Candidatus Moranbacteria bacterium]|nr:hypothetical protein [Candidatus Moranbacteria bacterium]
MNRKIVIGIIIALAVAGGVYFFAVKQADAPAVSGQPAGDAVPGETTLETESMPAEDTPGLLDFLTTRGAAKCAITSKDGQYTVVTDGKRARIEGIQVPAADPKAGMSSGTMINDGQYAYMWSGTQGMKIALTPATSVMPPQAGESKTDPKDWQGWARSLEASGVTYDCDATTVSESDFTPPTAVQFTDLSELMKQMPKDMKAVIPNQGSVPDAQSFELPAGMPVQQ